MKKILFLLLVSVAFASCKKNTVAKPAQLIEEGVMVNIIYDLTILEAVKYENAASLEANNIIPKEYIYKKYSIDSLQFAQNNQYYASDIDNYKKIYDQVKQKMEKKKASLDPIKKPRLTLDKK